MSDGGQDRWRLHRGGIVNMWQYRQETFDLSGGRAIFKGTNGSGKSRTLELLLPLCLDGDLRHMGCKGFDSVSMRRLMLEGYEHGRNRIGYAWVELRRVTATGTEFLTCGVGVKASSASNQISGSWRFVTSARVEIDLDLAGNERVPPSLSQLRELIGEEAVCESEEEFQDRVAEQVYGIRERHRYADLLHLQRTLRNPDIGLKVNEGNLENILSDALPPLDPGVIHRTAAGLENLEGARTNISRLSHADGVLSEFVPTYRGYVLGELSRYGETLRQAQKSLRSAETKQERKRREAEQARQALEQARSRQAELERGIEQLDAKVREIKDSGAYQELRDLEEKSNTVSALRDHAQTALQRAVGVREQERTAVETILRNLRALGRVERGARDHADEAGEALRLLGLDAALAPTVPTAPADEAQSRVEYTTTETDPQAPATAVERCLPPHVDVEELRRAVKQAGQQAGEAREAAAGRRGLISSLVDAAHQLDSEEQQLRGLRQQAETAREQATTADGEERTATGKLQESARSWVEHVRGWLEAGVLAELDGTRRPASGAPEDIADSIELARELEQGLRRWLEPHRDEARLTVLRTEHELEELRAEEERLTGERDELRNTIELTPQRPRWADAPRDPANGAAFYQLVDFREELPEEQRAGLEAALEASGLLNAWVSADGTVSDADTHDVLAVAAERQVAAEESAALGTLLVPAEDSTGTVPSTVVERLLARVAVRDDPARETARQLAGGFAVSVRGRWRAGALAGAAAKPAAELVGAGARAAARERRIAELDRQLATQAKELAAAEQTLTRQQEHSTAVERAFGELPDRTGLEESAAAARAARQAAQRAGRHASALEEKYAAAEADWQARANQHKRRAAELGLSPEAQLLRSAAESASIATGALERLGRTLDHEYAATLDDLGQVVDDHGRAVSERQQAEGSAVQACQEHATAAAALAELRASLGSEPQQLAYQLEELQRELGEQRKQLPQARQQLADRQQEEAKSAANHEKAQEDHEQRKAGVADAEDTLTTVLDLPGVWEAATGTGEEPPADRDRALETVDALCAEQRTQSKSAVHNRVPSLHTALAGSHDITTDERAGALTVTVSDEEGPLPVATAARRVSERLTSAQENLQAHEEEAFQEFFLKDVAEELRRQVATAKDLCRRMNEALARMHSSQGVHVQLEWQPASSLDSASREALSLVNKSYATRTPEENERLRRALQQRVEAERDGDASNYAELLNRALDYRRWYDFTVRAQDIGPDGKQRTRRLRQLSSGETRMISYGTLFAAAASFYDALRSTIAGPLRVVLLDEAFERLDDPTKARMLGLLVELNMDCLVTWPKGWGVSEQIPKMHIYDVLHRKGTSLVTCAHYAWDGTGLELVTE